MFVSRPGKCRVAWQRHSANRAAGDSRWLAWAASSGRWGVSGRTLAAPSGRWGASGRTWLHHQVGGTPGDDIGGGFAQPRGLPRHRAATMPDLGASGATRPPTLRDSAPSARAAAADHRNEACTRGNTACCACAAGGDVDNLARPRGLPRHRAANVRDLGASGVSRPPTLRDTTSVQDGSDVLRVGREVGKCVGGARVWAVGGRGGCWCGGEARAWHRSRHAIREQLRRSASGDGASCLSGCKSNRVTVG